MATDYNEIQYSYMKRFVNNCVWWIGVPSIIIGVLTVLDIKGSLDEKTIIDSVSTWVPWLLMLLVFWVGLKTTTETILDDRKKAAESFYAVCVSANIDRAFRVFYHLLQDGLTCKIANSQRRQEWDRQLIVALQQYCNTSNRDIYLCNTGRADSTVAFMPINDEQYDIALDHVRELLRTDFERAIN